MIIILNLATQLRTLWGTATVPAAPALAAHERPLTRWHRGQQGRVVRVTGGGALSCRLHELGLQQGTRVRVVQSGNPLVLQVGDSRLCLRGEEGLHVVGVPEVDRKAGGMHTLDAMRPGSRCRIVALHGRGPLQQRLYEMGLFEGEELEIIRLAPLGDPMELRVQGYNLSLRKAEARQVEVTPCE